MEGPNPHVEQQVIPSRATRDSLPEGMTTTAIGVMVLGAMLVVYAWRRRATRRAGAVASAMDERGLQREAREAPIVEAAALVRDLNELGERLAAELDSRAAKLDDLIAKADAKLDALNRATAAVEAKPAARGQQDSQFREVYELADRGLSALDIAAKTQRPTGQVELILNLRRGSVAI